MLGELKEALAASRLNEWAFYVQNGKMRVEIMKPITEASAA